MDVKYNSDIGIQHAMAFYESYQIAADIKKQIRLLSFLR
jgi:hypothetical protein